MIDVGDETDQIGSRFWQDLVARPIEFVSRSRDRDSD